MSASMTGLRTYSLWLSSLALLAACSGGQGSMNSGPTAQTASQARLAQKAAGIAASSYEDVTQELYLAYFGRPADPTGLVNIENVLLNAGAPTDAADLAAAYATNPTVKALFNSFASSAESQALYGSTSVPQFVNDVYQNLFDRAADVGGLQFWSNAISSDQLDQAAAAMSIMGAAAINDSTQGETDGQTIANRLSFAEGFTTALAAQNLSSDYTGNTAAQVLRYDVDAITASTTAAEISADVTAAIAQFTGSGTTSSSTPVLNAVAWSGAQFVAVGLGGIVETSPDGINWTNRGSAFSSPLSAADLRGVVWQGSRFIAVGTNGGTAVCTTGDACPDIVAAEEDSILSSADGITWANALSNSSASAIPSNSELNGILWNGSQFVAVGDQVQISDTSSSQIDDGHVLLSPDGENWSVITQYGSTTNAILPPLAGISWGGGQLVAVGSGIADSASGNLWSLASQSGTYTGVASSGTRYVAVGLSGALYSSPDGQNWTQHTATANNLYAVTWSGSQFVAVGVGTILTSPDGSTWTVRDAGTSNTLYGVTWSGSQFVAVGGAVVTSPDGITWTAQVVH